jgi:hypothetical protein
MQLPKELKIMSIPFKILYFDDHEKVHKSDNDGKVYTGFSYGYKQEFRILKGEKTIEGIWETIMHEVIHMLFVETGLVDLTGKEEERIVSALGSGINCFLWENGLLKRSKSPEGEK